MNSLYIGTYRKYNNGDLHGKWFDLNDYSCIEDFYADCKELHKDENDPEFMIMDTDGDVSAFISGDYINPLVFEWLELDDNSKDVVTYLINSEGFDADNAMDNIENVIILHCDNKHESADIYYDYLCENGTIDEESLGYIACYINKEALFNGDGNTFNFVSGLGLVSSN